MAFVNELIPEADKARMENIKTSPKGLTMFKRLLSFATLAAVLACAGCKKAPAANETSPPLERYVYKLNDQLHLALGPLELESVPIDKAALRAKFPDPKPPKVGFIQHFHFYVPGESALKDPERYRRLPPMNQQDENIVRVKIVEPWTEEMYRTQPDATRDARIGWRYRVERAMQRGERPEEMMGMQCYRNSGELECLAERAAGEWAIFDLDNQNSSAPYPAMRTKYFTKAYGGLTVAWVAPVKHAAKWREIDAKLWQLVAQWNIVETK